MASELAWPPNQAVSFSKGAERKDGKSSLLSTLMPSESFSTEYRLRKSADFEAVFKNTTIRVSGKYLLLLAKKNNLGHPRLGLVVAKKNVPQAVQRNRIKRNLRESFRCNTDCLAEFDLVLLCRWGIDKLDNSSIRAALTELWTQLTCRSEPSR